MLSSSLRITLCRSPFAAQLARAAVLRPPGPRRNPSVTSFHSGSLLRHKEVQKPKEGAGLQVNYVTPDGDTITVYANEGDNILDIAHANDIELEGACEGSLACSTCHVIVDQEHYDKLEEPSDEENDMLDLAFGLTETYAFLCAS
ncbi:hypothetical protein HDU85_001929 [Gaertneriomyces sp. JEL0708]|nr:hypothetical protein HDU85_001929 [Gaertneriomyces sp. JEL0708]